MLVRSVIRTAVVSAALALTAVAQQPAAKPAKQPGGHAVVNVTKGQAVVLFVNQRTRNITVMINKTLHNYTLSDSVKGLSKIKQGDTLNIQVVEALGVYLKKDSLPPVGTAAEQMTVQPVGKPAIEHIKVTPMSGVITHVDYANRVMSIMVPPKGDTMTFVADSSLHDIHAFKVGDHVAMRYTAAMVVAIDP